ncbi:MAG: hypothetical protein GY811_06035 [Myxococcales bacterium]|nr:hypothetical protein [Myxococcales bacterium]
MTTTEAINKAETLLKDLNEMAAETGSELLTMEDSFSLLSFAARRENDREAGRVYCHAYRSYMSVIDPTTLDQMLHE